MNTGINMRIGDVCDRWSILRMKVRFDESYQSDLEKYEEVVMKKLDLKKCLPYLADLIEANAKIWILEASIRKEFKDDASAQDDLSTEQIGRRILEIRPHNKRRLESKDKIDVFYGYIPDKKYFKDESIVPKKITHADPVKKAKAWENLYKEKR